jgi:hypothetical protein
MNGRTLGDAAAPRRLNLKVLFTTGYRGSGIVRGGRPDLEIPLLPNRSQPRRSRGRSRSYWGSPSQKVVQIDASGNQGDRATCVATN